MYNTFLIIMKTHYYPYSKIDQLDSSPEPSAPSDPDTAEAPNMTQKHTAPVVNVHPGSPMMTNTRGSAAAVSSSPPGSSKKMSRAGSRQLTPQDALFTSLVRLLYFVCLIFLHFLCNL